MERSASAIALSLALTFGGCPDSSSDNTPDPAQNNDKSALASAARLNQRKQCEQDRDTGLASFDSNLEDRRANGELDACLREVLRAEIAEEARRACEVTWGVAGSKVSQNTESCRQETVQETLRSHCKKEGEAADVQREIGLVSPGNFEITGIPGAEAEARCLKSFGLPPDSEN